MPRNASTPVISAKICMALNSYNYILFHRYYKDKQKTRTNRVGVSSFSNRFVLTFIGSIIAYIICLCVPGSMP